jgi:diguanylate cyclase (GGDEF)-like protein/PAS domain S-box-containing protein
MLLFKEFCMPDPIDHFKSLFILAPISLWEEDYSGIKRFFDELRSRGVADLNKHFDKHPDDVDACMRLIRVIHVNNETLEMFGANSEKELLENLDKVFHDEMRHHFRSELLTLWSGGISFSGEGINYTLQGKPLNIRLHWRILPECGKNWECVMVAIENITALKEAEARFRHLFNHAPISLWEEDYRGLKELFDELRTQGITDLQAYLSEHPELIDHFMSLIRVLDVNQKTLDLFGASSKETLLANIDKVFRDEMRQHFSGELMDMWNGKTTYEREGINYSLSGDPFNIHLDWRLMPGHENDFTWVLVAIQDITARKKAEEYLRYLGTHDVMTGLYNRAFFEEQMQKLSETQKVSILMADLDGLKLVNDKFGHQAGDNFVRRAAEVLKSAFEEENIAARIGGDEFAALLPGHNEEDAQKVIERIRSLIPLNNKYYQGPELNISLGTATRQKNETLEKTMLRADDSMYQEKAIHHHRRTTD